MAKFAPMVARSKAKIALADAIRAERSRRRLSQHAVAAIAGVDTGVVQRLESHGDQGVTIGRFFRVIAALEMRLHLLPADPSALIAVDPGKHSLTPRESPGRAESRRGVLRTRRTRTPRPPAA